MSADFGIGENVRVIPGALAKTMIVGHEMPRIAAVVGAIDSALLGFDHRPHAIGIRARNRDADAPENSFGQTVRL